MMLDQILFILGIDGEQRGVGDSFQAVTRHLGAVKTANLRLLCLQVLAMSI